MPLTKEIVIDTKINKNIKNKIIEFLNENNIKYIESSTNDTTKVFITNDIKKFLNQNNLFSILICEKNKGLYLDGAHINNLFIFSYININMLFGFIKKYLYVNTNQKKDVYL